MTSLDNQFKGEAWLVARSVVRGINRGTMNASN
jgi:hypothetical protein